ncbi:decarboxylase [Candidatus Woesearchaeota archaeon]|nr:decarboxylase [Candidatus Woesearchaeota archaeon]
MAHFTISKSIVLQQYNTLKEISNRITYSSKTNQDVTKILEENTDSMFSIHLKNELKHIKDLSRIIFLAQGWNEEFIQELVDKKINYFVVDNERDLDTFLTYLEKHQELKPNLSLRVKLRENSIKTERYFVFGIDVETVNKRIKELDKSKFNEIGIHFHRKTQNMSEWNLVYEIENMFEPEVLEKINVFNIGGGLPSEYANTNIKVVDSIFKRILEFKEFLNNHSIKLIIEPGRFIAAPAGKLITKIISIYENNIIIDASVYNTDMDAIVVPVKLKIEGELEKGNPFVIKGQTPCSMDLFRYRVYLNEPKIGDELVFLNAGAYNFASDFCDLEKLETRIVE